MRNFLFCNNSSNRRRNGGADRDEPVALALVALLLVYSVVTLLSYHRISSNEAASVRGGLTTVDNNESPTPQQDNKKQEADDDPIEKLRHTFPIHVGDDTEVIQHPGLTLVTNRELIPEDLPHTMTVPKFFEDSHGWVYGGSIRKYLGDDGDRLLTVEEAMSIGSFDSDNQETIYCSVASYRDPECKLTVSDLYERAKHPERIRVAILEQRALDDDSNDPICNKPPVPCTQDPSQALCKYQHLIDYYEMDARLAVGPVFARHLAHRHYRGEYFAMQIDSHVRFIEHWDESIVEQWKAANNEMAVLSTYLSDITKSIDPVTHEDRHKLRPIMCKSDYEGNGDYKHLRHGQQPEGLPGIHGEPTLHPFWAAGFSFARGHFVIQVPYDQYLPMVFQGEEISIGLRGFTYGYDYYAPEKGVCFHMYAIKDNEGRRKKVPLFWEHSQIYKGTGVRAMKRLNNIIGMAKKPDNDWQHDEEKKYGLGKVRKAEKFFKVFGIHTKTETVENHLCRFVGKPMMKVFKPALRENGMGLDYDKIDYEFVDPAPDDKRPR